MYRAILQIIANYMFTMALQKHKNTMIECHMINLYASNGKGYMHISNELNKAVYVYSTYPAVYIMPQHLFFHVPIRSGHNSIEIALQPVPSMPKNLWPKLLFFLSFFPKLNNVTCDYI